MAEQRAVFAVDLETGGVVEGSNAAADALARLKRQINDDQAALRELKAQLSAMQGATSVNVADFKRLKEAIASKQNSLAQASNEYVKLGGKLSEVGRKSRELAAETGGLGKRLLGLGETAGKVGGPIGLGALAPALQGFGAALSNPAVLVGVLTVALAASVVALTVYAAKLADAARSNRIFLDSVAGSSAGGEQLAATIRKVSSGLPLAREEVQKIAVALRDKGISGSALEQSLRAIGTATAVLGQSAGAKLQGVVEKSKELGRFMADPKNFEGSGISIDDVAGALARRTGGTVDAAKAAIKAGSVDLASGLQALDDAVQSKLGGNASKLNKSFDGLGNQLRNNLADIFSGVDVEPLLESLQQLVSLLDTSTESGKALQAIMKTIVNPLVEAMAGAVTTMTQGFLLMEIGAYGLGAAVYKTGNSIKAFFSGIKEKFDAIKNMSWSEIGTAIVDGIVNGIKAGYQKVKNAAKGLGSAIEDSVREAAEIKSPSRMTYRLGGYVSEGLAEGIEDGSDDVDRAATGLFDEPGFYDEADNVASRQRRAVAFGLEPAASRSVVTNDNRTGATSNVFHLNIVQNSNESSETFAQRVVRALEDMARSSGAPLVRAP